MGSTGSFNANMSLIKKQKVTIDTENSIDEIKKFIAKHQELENKVVYYAMTANLEKARDFKLISVIIEDEDKEYIETLLLSDLNLDMTLGEFLDSKIYLDKNYVNLFESEYCDADPCYWGFEVATDDKYKAEIIKKLKNIDLKAIDKNFSCWSINEPKIISYTEQLASCSNYIYCFNDNSTCDTFKITQKFIDSLTPGDVLLLKADGDGEHC